MSYQIKYLKYKNKYLDLKQKISGGANTDGSLGTQNATSDLIQQSTGSLINKISDVMAVDKMRGVSGTKILTSEDKEKIIVEVEALNQELLKVKAVGEQYVAEYRQINQLIDDASTAIRSGDKEVQVTAIKEKLASLESNVQKGIDDPHLNLYFLIIEILDSIQDGQIDKKEAEKIKSIKLQLDDDLKKTHIILSQTKKQLNSNKLKSTYNDSRQQEQIAELQVENKALKSRKKATDDAVIRLFNFFRYKNNLRR
jgi:hypothetical protein